MNTSHPANHIAPLPQENEGEAACEQVPIVDPAGHVLGSMTRQHAHDGSCVLHPVVHLHVFNSQGQLYLQHRPRWKDIQPDRWDTATGGHVSYGETIEEALRREVSEELGITGYEPRFVCRYVFESEREHELVHVFTTTYDGPLHPSPTELDGGRFWSHDEIAQAIGKGILTPNFEQEYTKCKLYQL